MARVINFEAQWDAEAGVWWAVCTGPEGIVTEAETVEALRERLRLIVPDYLSDETPEVGEVQINLHVTVSDVVKAA